MEFANPDQKLLHSKKLAFSAAFARDFQREFMYLVDVLSGRAEARENFMDKVMRTFSGLIEKAPMSEAGSVAVAVLSAFYRGYSEAKKTKRAQALEQMVRLCTDARLSLSARRIGDAIASAYEYQLWYVDKESLQKLATGAVMRILYHAATNPVVLSPPNLEALVGAVRLGKSGAFVDTWADTPVKTSKRNKKDWTVEGVFGRSGVTDGTRYFAKADTAKRLGKEGGLPRYGFAYLSESACDKAVKGGGLEPVTLTVPALTSLRVAPRLYMRVPAELLMKYKTSLGLPAGPAAARAPVPVASLSFAEFVSRELSGGDVVIPAVFGCMEGWDLSGLNLDGCDLSAAVMTGCVMRGGSLVRASLAGANVASATFSHVDMTKARLDDACLRDAHFTKVALNDCSALSTNFTGSTFAESSIVLLKRDEETDFTGVTIRDKDPAQVELVAASVASKNSVLEAQRQRVEKVKGRVSLGDTVAALRGGLRKLEEELAKSSHSGAIEFIQDEIKRFDANTETPPDSPTPRGSGLDVPVGGKERARSPSPLCMGSDAATTAATRERPRSPLPLFGAGAASAGSGRGSPGPSSPAAGPASPYALYPPLPLDTDAGSAFTAVPAGAQQRPAAAPAPIAAPVPVQRPSAGPAEPAPAPAASTSRGRAAGLFATLGSAPAVRYVDLCIVLDATTSMEPWLNEAKSNLRAIRESIEPAARAINMTLRIAVIVYRDYDNVKQETYVRSVEFDTDPTKAQKRLDVTEAKSGFDDAEDVASALLHARQLQWKGYRRILVHVCDAPPHGQEFHNGKGTDVRPTDFFWDGNTPNELPPNESVFESLDDLSKKRVDYYLVRAGAEEDLAFTSKMAEVFKRTYEGGAAGGRGTGRQELIERGRFSSLALGNAAKEFANFVIKAASTSMDC